MSRGPANRPQQSQGRSTTLPIFVAVILISAVAIFLALRGQFGGEPDPADVPADASVTAFWLETGGPMLREARDAGPEQVTDINDGQTCRPSEQVQAERCPSLPARYEEHALFFERLAGRARNAPPAPAGTSAEPWWTKQIEAWDAQAADFRRMAEIGRAGFADADWAPVIAGTMDGVRLQSEAEVLLGSMLLAVEPESRIVPMR
ncbi:MAG: hypothetical protein AMXMBFR23_28790 [Chloroflexota bacterium]